MMCLALSRDESGIEAGVVELNLSVQPVSQSTIYINVPLTTVTSRWALPVFHFTEASATPSIASDQPLLKKKWEPRTCIILCM